MPVYQLPDEIVFPSPEEAEPSGLLAVGGDLSVARLLLAYSAGIFPWYAPGDPILWWSPDPRLVLEPSGLRVSKSLKRTVKKGVYTVTVDRAFERTIRACARAERSRDEGTWIVDDMIEAYTRLHQSGFAHSVETWQAGELVGGLYGVSIGKAFFGESMFSARRDASKVALVYLAGMARRWDMDFIDCQITTGHLVRMGAGEVARSDFLERLRRAVESPTRCGTWVLPEGLELLPQAAGARTCGQ